MKQEPGIEPVLEAETFDNNDEILKRYELFIDESKIENFNDINFISLLDE